MRNGVLKAGLSSIIIKAVGACVQFLLSILLARLLGPGGLGTYTFAFAIAQVASTVAQFGFPNFLVKSVAKATAASDGKLACMLSVQSITMVALGSSGIVSIGFALILSHNEEPTPANTAIMLVALLLVPPLAISASSGGALRGLGRIVSSQFPDEVARPLLMLAMLITALALGANIGANDALVMHVVAAAASLLSSLAILYHTLKNSKSRLSQHQSERPLPSPSRISLLAGSAPFFFLVATQLALYQADVFSLAAFSKTEQLGFYRVAQQIQILAAIPIAAFSAVIAPKIVDLDYSGQATALRKLLRTTHKTVALLLLPSVLLVMVSGDTIISLFFGNEFLPSVLPLKILLVSKLIFSLLGFYLLALTMTGYIWLASGLTAVCVFINFFVCITLVPSMGANGAAIASGSSYIALGIGGAFFWHRKSMDRNVIKEPSV